jgi:hypothetical protein
MSAVTAFIPHMVAFLRNKEFIGETYLMIEKSPYQKNIRKYHFVKSISAFGKRNSIEPQKLMIITGYIDMHQNWQLKEQAGM